MSAHRWLGEWFEGREVTFDVAQERVHQWRQAGDRNRLRACLLQEAVFRELYEEDEYVLLGHWLWLDEDIEAAYAAVFEQWKHANRFELAVFLRKAGYFGDFSESLHRRALDEASSVLGAEHPDTLGSVNDLALLLSEQGAYTAAEPLYRRALEGRETALGVAHPDTLTSVSSLAL